MDPNANNVPVTHSAPNPTPPPSNVPYNYPTHSGSSDVPPPGRFSRSKKKLVFLGVGLLILIVIIVATMLFSGKTTKKELNVNGIDSSLQIHRKGYTDDETKGAVGDAYALSATVTDKIISFAGVKVIQPCSLLTPQDIRDNGSLLLANPLTAPVIQNTYSGQGDQKPKELSKYFIPFGDDGDNNSCQYSIKKPADSEATNHIIEISVMQGIDISQQAYDIEIAKYTAQPALPGNIDLFVKNVKGDPRPNETEYMLRSKNAAVKLRFVLTDAEKNIYLKLIAARLKKAETTPTGEVVLSLKSTIFNGKIYESCSILDDKNFEALTGAKSSPFTRQTYASAIGIVENAANAKILYNYADYACSRNIADDEKTGTSAGQMSLRATTYETEDGAKDSFAFTKTLTQELLEIKPAVGNESYFGQTPGKPNSFVFR
jgi:hypothetical protein